MKNTFLLLLLLPLLLLLSGGCLLPSGTPPEGKIVSNPMPQKYAATQAEAVEMVIPELTAALLECPEKAVALDAPPPVYRFAKQALTECCKLTGHRLCAVRQTSCRLQLVPKGKTWHWKLFRNGREVWSKTVLLH